MKKILIQKLLFHILIITAAIANTIAIFMYSKDKLNLLPVAICAIMSLIAIFFSTIWIDRLDRKERQLRSLAKEKAKRLTADKEKRNKAWSEYFAPHDKKSEKPDFWKLYFNGGTF